VKVEILGIIPARGGSKGIPRKNVRLLAGRPLIHYTNDSAQKSRMLNRVVVSTEDEEIAELASQYGCEILHRPSELALDETPMVPVIQHVVNSLSMNEDYLPEITVVLQPTAPLRCAEHIDDCLSRFLESNANSMVSVCPVPGHYHPDWQFNITPEGALCMFSSRPLNQIQTHRQDAGEGDTPSPKKTFVHRHNAYWLKRKVEALMPMKILVWRSVSTRFLRTLIHRRMGGRWILRLIYWLEEHAPHFFGLCGQYPLIVICKA